mmetsp:Transcript_66437/g.98485  ORF Transcript_66437/g.98485 Transcript_66437/m.98485 type:complete len:396 (-) Transcript_66437:446-1633(-)
MLACRSIVSKCSKGRVIASSRAVRLSSSKAAAMEEAPSFQARSHIPVPPRSNKEQRKGPLSPRHSPNRMKAIWTFNAAGSALPMEGSDTRGDYSLNAEDELERNYGPHVAEIMKDEARARQLSALTELVGTKLETGGETLDEIEAQLRSVDYMTSALGSTEDLMGMRRGLSDCWDEGEAEQFERELERVIEEERIRALDLGSDEPKPKVPDVQGQDNVDDKDDNDITLAHGEWSETVIKVDRVQKVQRGGTMVRYRALAVGGNTNGCAGFGVAKASSPAEAVAAACRMTKRNIFFVDRYDNTGLTTDLAGKHNSCKVVLRSVTKDRGLNGHPLISVILKYFGISDCSSKSYGNRNAFNVVRATFKALMTHESLEEMSMKRGKRIITLDRARKLML